MNKTIEQLQRLARAWRKRHGFLGKGGFVSFWNGKACGWMSDLSDTASHRPGCLALSEEGALYRSEGGDYWRGSHEWRAAA